QQSMVRHSGMGPAMGNGRTCNAPESAAHIQSRMGICRIATEFIIGASISGVCQDGALVAKIRDSLQVEPSCRKAICFCMLQAVPEKAVSWKRGPFSFI